MKQFWIPEKVHGKDGKDYWVYTMFAAGRGRYHKMYLTPSDNQYREIEVEIIPFGRNHKGVHVNILSDRDVRFQDFAMKPYVQKDGTSGEHVKIAMYSPEGQELKKLYGVFYLTPDNNYLEVVYGKPLTIFLQ